jgi:hypothetical protein
MTMRDLLGDARALLGAASSTSDENLRVLYVGKARAAFAQLREQADLFERELAAVEAALVAPAKPEPERRQVGDGMYARNAKGS